MNTNCEVSAGFKARLEYVLDQVCMGVPDGGSHELRRLVAAKLVAAAQAGELSMEGLTAVAREALASSAAPAVKTA
jgi:hypothetical protein